MSNRNRDKDLLYKACVLGDIEQINKLIENGNTEFISGLIGAAVGNYFDLAKLMLDKLYPYDGCGGFGTNWYNIALYHACEHHSTELGELLIKRGATHCSYCKNALHRFIKEK